MWWELSNLLSANNNTWVSCVLSMSLGLVFTCLFRTKLSHVVLIKIQWGRRHNSLIIAILRCQKQTNPKHRDIKQLDQSHRASEGQSWGSYLAAWLSSSHYLWSTSRSPESLPASHPGLPQWFGTPPPSVWSRLAHGHCPPPASRCHHWAHSATHTGQHLGLEDLV